MKSYTDLEQSKKLAEILPIESADMRYGYIAPYDYSDRMYDGGYDDVPYPKDFLKRNPNFSENEYDGSLPCWSLASLLEQLDDEITDEDGNDYNLTIVKESLQYQLYYHDSWGRAEDIETDYYDDLVDACYEMIVKLKEKNLL